jgi:hypothetical protein
MLIKCIKKRLEMNQAVNVKTSELTQSNLGVLTFLANPTNSISLIK